MIISTSSVMFTSSPTTTPPLSSFWFQATPKSCRLIFVEADTAVRCKPQGSLMGALGTVALDLGGLKSDGGILGDVEERLALQVLVAVGFPGIHGGGVDGDVYAGFGNIRVIHNHRSGDAMKFAAHGRNHQVRHAKTGA